MKSKQNPCIPSTAVGALLFATSAFGAPLPRLLHVNHYALNVAIDPAGKSIVGTVTIRFTLHAGAALHALPVNMGQTLAPSKVKLDGRSVAFKHRGDVLDVASSDLAVGKPHTLIIAYSGQPTMRGLHFGTLNGKPVVASYGLPYSAQQWWPDFDDPALKADSAEIDVTVPAGLTAASNGTLMAVKNLPDGRRRYRWHESAPIYPDVISVAIGPYVKVIGSYTSISGRKIPLVYYLYAEDRAKAESEFAIVPGVLHIYEQLFGPYPFQHDKYGIAEFPIPSFREHQTLPSLGRGLILGTSPVWDLGNVANVIAHDMAHQWFGNSLTPKSWSDVWLNEGFATYAVALWREKQDGEAGYRAYMRSLDATTFDGPIYIQDNTSLHALLTPTTFNKGAWVLHMLRRVMGDKAFFTALRNYVATNRGGLVDTQAWIAACEQAYGKPLNWFFKEWVHGTGRPALRLTWKQTRDDRLALTVDQTQAGQVFTMPVDVAVKTASGESVTLVWLRHRHENVDLPVKGKVVGVVVDPGGWLLKAHPGHGT